MTALEVIEPESRGGGHPPTGDVEKISLPLERPERLECQSQPTTYDHTRIQTSVSLLKTNDSTLKRPTLP